VDFKKHGTAKLLAAARLAVPSLPLLIYFGRCQGQPAEHMGHLCHTPYVEAGQLAGGISA